MRLTYLPTYLPTYIPSIHFLAFHELGRGLSGRIICFFFWLRAWIREACIRYNVMLYNGYKGGSTGEAFYSAKECGILQVSKSSIISLMGGVDSLFHFTYGLGFQE